MAAIGHPIVGDGKYGGQDAFLTGSISRKMHLHARRLIIDAPKATAAAARSTSPPSCPSISRRAWSSSASIPRPSDAAPAKGPPPPPRAAKKQAAKAHAKHYRKARRGERAHARRRAPPSKRRRKR